MNELNWHTQSIEESARRIATDITTGLSSETARRRLELHGANRTRTREHKTLLGYFGEQLGAVLVVILFATAVISAVVAVNDTKGGNWLEAFFIVIMILLIALAGALLERRIDAYSEQLENITAAKSRVLRDGAVTVVSASELVPGDVVILDAGELVPADGRLIRSQALLCDQSTVTGDGEPVLKDADALPHVTAPVAQRDNMVYAGSSVISGRGAMLVTETGMGTEAGKLASLLGEKEYRGTPLKVQLADMGKHTAAAGLIVALVLFIVGFICRHPNDMKAIEVFMICMSLAVAVIPEWTAPLTTLIRLRGALDMVRRGVVVRNADSEEKLSCVTVICTGKGGTVGQNSMEVVRAWTPDGRLVALGGELSPEVSRLLRYAALSCSTGAELEAAGQRQSPGEAAITHAVIFTGESKHDLDLRYPRVGVEKPVSGAEGDDTASLSAALPAGVSPYDSERRQMTTVHRIGGKLLAITRGAPDSILPLCDGCADGAARAICEKLGASSMHVVAVAFRELSQPLEDPAPGEDDRLTFVGILGMTSTPDDDAKQSAELCRQAGIRVVMTTSDQPSTAEAIARSIGILQPGEGVLDASRLAEMSDRELESNLRKFSVYAGVTAEQRLRIVRLWQNSGETVMVTGASVADVPALREADVGCAMGVMGTGVAQGTADVAVSDDSFATMICAVNGGRTIYDNIRKAVSYILSCCLGRAVAVAAVTLLTGASSLLPLQLLLSFLLTGFAPPAAFGCEPPEEGVMMLPPRRADRTMFTLPFVLSTVLRGVTTGAAACAAFFIGRRVDTDTARTMAFAALTCGQLLLALSARSGNNVLGYSFIENRRLLLSVGICLAIVVLTMVTPLGIFVFAPLTAGQAGICAGLAAAPFVLCELAKPLYWALSYSDR